MQEVGYSLDTVGGAAAATGGNAQRAWRRAFTVALAMFATLPAVSLADTDSGLRQEVEQLKSQLHALQKQVDAAPSASADAKTAAIVEEATADDSKLVTAKGSTLKLGGLKLTLGGFIAAETVWRSRNQSGDVISSFTKIPYANSQNYYTSEFRETARQSRVQMLAQGPSTADNKVEAFVAADFLSAGSSSNSNQSYSYTLRMREGYATWYRPADGFYLLGGQTWSLATPYKAGLNPRSENIPLTIEGAYVVGFNYLRVPQLRFVESFGSSAAIGLSLESPQNLVKGTAPAATTANNTGGSTFDPTATLSTDIAPDVIVKAAFDPGFGHYEVYSLTRFFRDRAPPTGSTAATATRNNTTIAESLGADLLLPVVPKLIDFSASALIGRGNGRYGAAQLGDSTYNAVDHSISSLQEQQFMVGLIGHPTPRVDLYTYAGVEHLNGVTYGYGPAATGAGCAVLAGSCSANSKDVRQVTGGFWWKAYKGSIGYVNLGAQVQYTLLSAFTAADGAQPKTNSTNVFLSFRYYPYQ